MAIYAVLLMFMLCRSKNSSPVMQGGVIKLMEEI